MTSKSTSCLAITTWLYTNDCLAIFVRSLVYLAVNAFKCPNTNYFIFRPEYGGKGKT